MSPLKKAGEGALLGSAVVMGVTPLIYAKNMAQTNRPFVLGHCTRGILFNSSSVVPTTAVAQVIEHVAKPYLGDVGAGAVAGIISGMVNTAPEAIVQTKQGAKNGITVWYVIRVAKINCFRGVFATAVREGVYAPGYMVLAPLIQKSIKAQVENRVLNSLVSAAIAGSIVAGITAPFDTMRAVKQDHIMEFVPARSYWQIASELGAAGLFRGLVPRATASSIAIFLMDQGRRAFST